MRTVLKTTISVAWFVGAVFLFAHGFAAREKGTDFPAFYAAAKMVQAGEGARLYEFAAQDEFQARYAGRIGDYFMHPSFEAWLFLPFARWPLPVAYGLWCAANALALAWTAKLVSRWIVPAGEPLAYMILSLLFMPLILNFWQGQDSVLLLFFETAALAAIHQDNDPAAGVWLALALFKFHLVLPLILLITLHRGTRILRGFIPVALALLLICVAICGWDVLVVYPRFLLRQAHLPLGGIHPAAMANLRGLVALLPINRVGGFILTLLLSAVVLGIAAVNQRSSNAAGRERLNLIYSVTVVASILVSYHAGPHDLTLLLLPMAIFAGLLYSKWEMKRREVEKQWKIALAVLAVLFLPPVHLYLLTKHEYAGMALPILALFAALIRQRAVWNQPPQAAA